MDSPTQDEARAAVASFDSRRQKIVAGMLGVMIQEPTHVRDREWMSEHLTRFTLLAGDFAVDTPDQGVQVVQSYLAQNSVELLAAATLLFQRVALDLAPQVAGGFTFEDAMRRGLSYLPAGGANPAALERDLGEQPLAGLMAEHGLEPKHLVAASTEQLTHKMVTRALKGRRLTRKSMDKVQRAWNSAAGTEHGRAELFSYEP